MRSLTLILFIIFSISVISQQENYGREISLTEVTKVSDILSEPEQFVGKDVLIEGEILDVCSMAGCWIEVKSDKTDQKIKVKVKDGDIVFPVEAKGKTAMVEGTVYRINLTKEEAINYYEHLAEEQGTEFDESSVTGPITFYQIKGLGAVIK